MKKEVKKKKLYNIEFIRFVFAICIIYFHLLHSYIMPHTKNSNVYQYLSDQVLYSKYIVECFFIMSGYFLYHTIRNHPDWTVGTFVCKKISRLWPSLACSVIIMAAFFGKTFYASFLDLLFLQSSGLATDWKGLNWYVSAFFVAEVFYFLLDKCVNDPNKMKLITCLLVYFGYELNISGTDGEFGRNMIYGVFNMGVARAIAGVGLGYLIGQIYESASAKWRARRTVSNTKDIKETVVISCLELVTLIMLIINFFFNKYAYENQFIVVVLFAAFFICQLTGKGAFSRITNNPVAGFAGKYAYSVYVMQEVAFAVMKHTWWKSEDFIYDHVVISLGISVFMAVAIGILTYYLIEKPGAKIMIRLFSPFL